MLFPEFSQDNNKANYVKNHIEYTIIKDIIQGSKIYYDPFSDAKAAADAEGRAINWDTDLPEALRPQANAFRALYNKLETLGDELHRMQSKHSPQLGRIAN